MQPEISHPVKSGRKKYWDLRKQEPLIEELIKYISTGTVLDMGAGWSGRDAFYLADKGFDVTAAEIDDKCVQELNRRNTNQVSPLRVIKADILTYQSKQLFDVVISDMVLHFLNTSEVPAAINNLQNWTKPGGYNVVLAYTTENSPGKRPYLFKHEELAGYYDDWKLIHYKEEPTPWFHLEGEPKPRRNHAVYLIAQKSN